MPAVPIVARCYAAKTTNITGLRLPPYLVIRRPFSPTFEHS
jgi:hypothetical protein